MKVKMKADTLIDEAPKNDTVIGTVVGCVKLNIREKPCLTAGILATVACGSKVQIDETSSTESFYKICTAFGIEGYCVKTYIALP